MLRECISKTLRRPGPCIEVNYDDTSGKLGQTITHAFECAATDHRIAEMRHEAGGTVELVAELYDDWIWHRPSQRKTARSAGLDADKFVRTKAMFSEHDACRSDAGATLAASCAP